MYQQKSAYMRFRRSILLIDATGNLRATVLGEAESVPCVLRTLPNETRARVHLSGEEHFDALLFPLALGSIAPVPFAKWVRSVRRGLPLVVLTENDFQSGELMAQLQEEGLDDPLIRVVSYGSPTALGEALLELLSPRSDEIAPASSKREAA